MNGAAIATLCLSALVTWGCQEELAEESEPLPVEIHAASDLRVRSPGRGRPEVVYEVVEGDHLVLVFEAEAGGSPGAYDTRFQRAVALELPARAAGGESYRLPHPEVRVFARVAGHKVLFLSHKAEGTVTLNEGGAVEVDLRFVAPVIDRLEPGAPLSLSGTFQGGR